MKMNAMYLALVTSVGGVGVVNSKLPLEVYNGLLT